MQRERLVSALTNQGYRIEAYSYPVVRQTMFDQFSATRTGLQDPNIRHTSNKKDRHGRRDQRRRRGGRNFLILDQGEYDGADGFWLQDEDTLEEGFLAADDETVFWTIDDNEAFIAREASVKDVAALGHIAEKGEPTRQNMNQPQDHMAEAQIRARTMTLIKGQVWTLHQRCCTRAMGSRYAVNRLIKAVERYAPGKIEFTFSPSNTKFSFADSETALIKVLDQGKVPILFSIEQMRKYPAKSGSSFQVSDSALGCDRAVTDSPSEPPAPTDQKVRFLKLQTHPNQIDSSFHQERNTQLLDQIHHPVKESLKKSLFLMQEIYELYDQLVKKCSTCQVSWDKMHPTTFSGVLFQMTGGKQSPSVRPPPDVIMPDMEVSPSDPSEPMSTNRRHHSSLDQSFLYKKVTKSPQKSWCQMYYSDEEGDLVIDEKDWVLLTEEYDLLTEDDKALSVSPLKGLSNLSQKAQRKEATAKEKRELKKQFDEAKAAEYQSWLDNDVFELIDTRKLGNIRNYVTGRWVLTLKRDKDGKFLKCKARWVLRGFQDRQKDIQQTDSPAASRLAIQLAANKLWNLTHIDLKTAFLQGEAYDESRDIICQIPPEAGYPPYIAARVKKPAYGLNDAPRRWWNIVDKAKALLSYGLVPTRADREYDYEESVRKLNRATGLSRDLCFHILVKTNKDTVPYELHQEQRSHSGAIPCTKKIYELTSNLLMKKTSLRNVNVLRKKPLMIKNSSAPDDEEWDPPSGGYEEKEILDGHYEIVRMLIKTPTDEPPAPSIFMGVKGDPTTDIEWIHPHTGQRMNREEYQSITDLDCINAYVLDWGKTPHTATPSQKTEEGHPEVLIPGLKAIAGTTDRSLKDQQNRSILLQMQAYRDEEDEDEESSNRRRRRKSSRPPSAPSSKAVKTAATAAGLSQWFGHGRPGGANAESTETNLSTLSDSLPSEQDYSIFSILWNVFLMLMGLRWIWKQLTRPPIRCMEHSVPKSKAKAKSKAPFLEPEVEPQSRGIPEPIRVNAGETTDLRRLYGTLQEVINIIFRQPVYSSKRPRI
ncbi:RE2 [Symbiodinium sp. KB8]|nr:RE2 [Symbiodinium sp. KB8]